MGNDFNARLIEIRENSKEIDKIAKKTQVVLGEDNNISITHAEAIPTIAIKFLEQVYVYLKGQKSPGTDVELNVGGIIELGISHRAGDDGEKTGNYVPTAKAGQEARLLVKDDDETEDE